tara:strand:- start:808 stop:1377 length:570 start_codon:yes stop_codon:yes gene_type:complete
MDYGTPKQLTDGRYYLKTIKDGQRVFVQLKDVRIMTKFNSEENVTLSIPETAQYKIMDIDSQNIDAAKANSQEWFGREVPEKTIEAAYTKSLSDGIMNVGKATVNKNVMTKIYNSDRTMYNSELLEENTECNVILEFSGLVFMKKTFSPIWRVAQIMLKKAPKSKYPEECMFENEVESEIESDNDDDYI